MRDGPGAQRGETLRGRLPRGLRAGLVALLVAACGGGTATPTPAAPTAGTPGASLAAVATPPPSGSPTPRPTPIQVATPAPSPTPTLPPTAAPVALQAATLATRLPTPLSRTVAFVDGGTLVICGGWTGAASTGVVYRVEPVAGTVVTAGKLATGVQRAAGASIGDLWLVMGGAESSPVDVSQYVERFGSAKQVGQLPAARSGLAAGTVGGTAILAGGGGTGAADPAVLTTVDGVTFEPLASLPVAVRHAAAAVLGGRLYLLGGELASGETAAIQAIDPVGRTATQVARLPAGLSHAMAFVLNGRLYLAGGRRAGAAVKDIVAVDPATGRTTPAGSLPLAFSDGYAVTVGNKVYIVGGEASQVLDTIVAIGPMG